MTDGQKWILYLCLIGVVLLLIWQIVDARHARQVQGWNEGFRDVYSRHIADVDTFCLDLKQVLAASGIDMQCPGWGTGRVPPPPPD